MRRTRNPLRSTDDQAPPEAAPQFAHIQRYWDAENDGFAAKLLPGEYYVTARGELVTTVLGSCVSACVRDRRTGVGGMNHFMLPRDQSLGNSAWGSAASSATRYGNVAMERMINDILKLGARREDLEFKLVGGGKVLGNMSLDIGARNIDFVRRYVKDEKFQVVGEDLGDRFPRKVVYFPATGRLRVKKLASTQDRSLIERESSYMNELETAPVAGETELF
jgi:chemotaxis protein CheD